MLTRFSRIQISIAALCCTIVIVAVKIVAYLVTDSIALQSDALEGLVNIVTGVFTVGAVMFAERPADANHPYGHGKIEAVSAAFEGGLITFAALVIWSQALYAWYNPQPLQQLPLGVLINGIGGVCNGALGYALMRAGRARQSQALLADGAHILSDFYSTLALLLGMSLTAWTGLQWIDALLAAVVGTWLGVTGYQLIRGSFTALLDEEDPQLLHRVLAALNARRTPEIIDVHALRSLRSGRRAHIDIHIAVPEYASLLYAHDTTLAYTRSVLADVALDGEFHIHLDPCRQALCAQCEVSNCPVRCAPFHQLQPFCLPA